MESKGAKIGFIVLVLLVFGGAVYFMYGPNSHNAKQNKATTERLKNYVKAEAEIITSETNGRTLKGADIIYTVQFKDEKTGDFKTATFYGRDGDWDNVSKEKGSKLTLYYDPESPNAIVSEQEYTSAMK